MRRTPFVIAALVVLAATAWATRLAFDAGPLGPGPAAVIGLNLLSLAVIVATGLLIARSRWARNLGVAVSVGHLAIAATVPLDARVVAPLVLTTIAVAGLFGPWLDDGWLRKLPTADGPPTEAIVLILTLTAFPAVAAAASVQSLDVLGWVVSGAAPILAWGLSRSSTAALWGVRLGFAPLGVAAGLSIGGPAGAVEAALAIGTGALAWSRPIGIAVAPLVPPRAPVVPIPPELAPSDVLDASGFDDQGRPMERR